MSHRSLIKLVHADHSEFAPEVHERIFSSQFDVPRLVDDANGVPWMLAVMGQLVLT